MTIIVAIAVIGIVLLQSSGAIPLAGMGGAMAMGWAILAAVPAVGIHEAWTRKRGVPGWILSILIALFAALLVAPLGGMVIVLLLGAFMDGPSLATSSGPVQAVGVAGMTVVTLMGAWAVLQIVGRWR